MKKNLQLKLLFTVMVLAVSLYDGFCSQQVYKTEPASKNSAKLALSDFPDGLVAYYDFDEGEGTTAKDSVGSIDGSLYNMNAENWVEGFLGTGISFTNAVNADTTAFVDIPNSDAIDYDQSESFSVSVLVKAPLDYGSEQTIFSKGMVGISNGGWYHLSYKAGNVRFMVWDSTTLSSPEGSTPFLYPENDWVHLVCVRDASIDSLLVYANGTLLDKCLDETNSDIANDGNLYLGTSPQWQTGLQGSVDELQVYNKALSAAEIKDLSLTFGFEEIPLGTNTNLTDIKVNFVSIDGFSPDILSYDVIVEGYSLISATAEDESSEVTVDVPQDVPGIATITVTAENGAQKVYTLNLVTLPSDDANLASLSVAGAELTPVFNAETVNYSVSLPENTTEISISATASSELAGIEGDGTISLASADTTVEVTVTAENGDEKVYSIAVTVEQSSKIARTLRSNNLVFYNAAINSIVSKDGALFQDIEIYSLSGKLVLIEKGANSAVVSLNSGAIQSGAMYIAKYSTTNQEEGICKFIVK